jgi:tetratricopeptide (TPR) repeat protein
MRVGKPTITRSRKTTRIMSANIGHFSRDACALFTQDALTIDGISILRERADEIGRLLWLTHRMARRRLLHRDPEPPVTLPAAEVGRLEAISPPLASSIQALWRSEVPGADAATERITGRLKEVADSLSGLNLVNSAVSFLETAALIDHRSPAAALTVARFARDHALFSLAELWYQDATDRARSTGDTAQLAAALNSRGNLLILKGNYPAAVRQHERALRLARRGGHRRENAMAAHDLSTVLGEMGHFAKSDRHAEEAAQAYGAGHPRLPNLIHDIAASWIDRGEFSAALPVLKVVLPLISDHRERMITWGNVARAAGGQGLAQEYADAAARVVTMQRERHWRSREAQCYLELAWGAHYLGDLRMARWYARRAEKIGTRRGEGAVRLIAEAVGDAARAGRQSLKGRGQQTAPSRSSDVERIRDSLIRLVSVPG